MIINNVMSPLQQAIIHNNASMVKLLVESGTQDVNGQSEAGTALHVLAIMPNIDPQIPELLIANGANVNSTENPDGDTPLHTAAICNPSTSVIVALIKNGADVNIPNGAGYTALEYLSIRRDWKHLQQDLSPYIQIPSNTVPRLRKTTGKKKEIKKFMRDRWEALDHFTKGYTYAQTGCYAESIKAYAKGLRHYPYKKRDSIGSIPASARVFFADTHNNIGASYARMGQWRSALEEYKKILFYLPGDPEALNNIGACYENLGDMEKSITSRLEALIGNPDYAEARANLGNSYMLKKEFEAAIVEYTHAINIWQKNGRGYTYAYFQRAVCYNNLNMFREAIADYDLVKQYDFENKYIIAYQNQGSIYALQGDHIRAIDDFTQVINKTKNNHEKALAYNSRAISYAVSGNVRQAFEDFSMAIKLYPGYDEPVYNLEVLKRKYIGRMF